jgi:NTE family protein
MLAELVDRGIRADRVYGASVGAVNGAAYAGDPTPAGMRRLYDVWDNLTGEMVFPRGRVHGPWMFFQQRPSVHSNAGLRQVVSSGLNFERLEDAVIPLEVVVTSLTNGEERWLTEGPATDAIVASATIPAILPPVVIDGDVLVDGGVVNNVPISRAVAAGATRIYVMLCGPLHFVPPQPKRPIEAVLTAFYVAIHARFARELATLPPGVEVVVFSGGNDPSADYRDFSGARQMMAEGRAEVAAVLDGDPSLRLVAQADVTSANAGSAPDVDPTFDGALPPAEGASRVAGAVSAVRHRLPRLGGHSDLVE